MKKNGYVKLYEEFIDDDYEMQRIIKELEKRANYWFTEGELAKDAQLVQIKQTETATAVRKSLMVEFNDNDFYYQLIIRVNIEEMDKCEVILKKYNPNSTSEDLELVNQLNMTGENKVDINDIKSEFVLDKIAELDKKSDNPDENEIDVPKEPEPETPPTEETPPAQEGGTPPVQGGTPPAQGTPPPPQGGTPPPQGGTPAL